MAGCRNLKINAKTYSGITPTCLVKTDVSVSNGVFSTQKTNRGEEVLKFLIESFLYKISWGATFYMHND